MSHILSFLFNHNEHYLPPSGSTYAASQLSFASYVDSCLACSNEAFTGAATDVHGGICGAGGSVNGAKTGFQAIICYEPVSLAIQFLLRSGYLIQEM